MKGKERIVVLGGILWLVACFLNSAAAQGNGEPKLEAIAEFGKSMAIGLSVNAENRVFVSFPNYDGDGKYALAEIINGKLKAYPNNNWNTKAADKKGHFLRIQDLFVDNLDYLWVLDSKPAPGGDIFKSANQQPRAGIFSLIKINTKTNQVEKDFDFPDLDKSVSSLNDVRVDTKNQIAYLSDPGQAAIVILDLQTGHSRTVLANSSFTKADTIVLRYDGKEMKTESGQPFSSNVNGIALTHDGKYLYFKPINKEQLFRIDTRFIRDVSLSEEELESKVETVGKVGVTHGLLADKDGNIYLTTSEGYAISYINPEGQLKVLVNNRNLRWPDSMGIGTDGYLYISCSQLQLLPTWNNGEDKTHYPYKAYRVRLPIH